MNARYYDPENGRFISQDSYRGEMDDPGQWHLYAYCANNPVNYVDPSGHAKAPTYYTEWDSYYVRGKGTLIVSFGYWQSHSRKQVLTYNNASVRKEGSLGKWTKVIKKQTIPKNKFVNTINIRAALGIWKTVFGGPVRDTKPWSVMIMDINIRGEKSPTVKIRKKSMSYDAYKRWKWGKF